jgi:dTDP-4-amino-4,6-dideoxygalactose transaminase
MQNNKNLIPLFWPELFREEWLKELGEIFNTRWIGQGPKVDEFERSFGEKFGYKNCLAVNSGSSALELAYHLIGLGPGDEVLTTVFTCTATNLPLLRMGCDIKFVDIGLDLVINPNDLITKISRKTKAIVVVTLGGLPIDEKIFQVARSFGIPVVVDAAQSVGVSENDGDFICYSFQAIKHFTTIDGGMLICRNDEDHIRAKKLRWFGIDRDAKKRAGWHCLVNHQMAMDIEEPGYKFHMNDVCATLGLVGLRHSDEILLNRQGIVLEYVLQLECPVIAGGACWLVAIISDNRDRLMDACKDAGIETDLIQLRNDIFKVFGEKRQDLPVMNMLEDKYLYLPINCKVTAEDVNYICKVVNDNV